MHIRAWGPPTALLSLLVLGAALTTDAGSAQTATPSAPASSTVVPTPTAFAISKLSLTLLADTGVTLESEGATVTRAGLIVVKPGQTSLPFSNAGVTVLSVIAGQLTVSSSEAVARVNDLSGFLGLAPIEATPGPISSSVISPGESVLLQPGAITTVACEGDAQATVYVVAVIPVD